MLPSRVVYARRLCMCGFPGELSTAGITSLVLLFHPYHLKEFEMASEGTESWQGRATRKVRFEQRMDQPARMSALRVGDAIYSNFLKGTAWIDQQSYQIVHLETECGAADDGAPRFGLRLCAVRAKEAEALAAAQGRNLPGCESKALPPSPHLQ